MTETISEKDLFNILFLSMPDPLSWWRHNLKSVVQPATRWRLRSFGFTFEEQSGRPSLYTVYSLHSEGDIPSTLPVCASSDTPTIDSDTLERSRDQLRQRDVTTQHLSVGQVCMHASNGVSVMGYLGLWCTALQS